jgi:inner membrane protease ATP23
VNEFFRGSLNVRNGHQKCVRRRAVLSTAMNPACESKAHAVEAVDAVFQTCFNDHRPFEDIP